MYIQISERKCHNEYGDIILKNKQHNTHVVYRQYFILNHWDVYRLLSIKWEEARTGECAFQAAHSCKCTSVITQHIILIATFLLENKPFVGSDPAGFVFYKKENRTRHKLKHSDLTRKHKWLEVNSM